MATLSKEVNETVSSKETAVSPASSTSQSANSQIHSDAVSLEVALKVHGSKVTDGGRGVPPRTEPFEEQTSSMIVFPHGGVLRMTTQVNVGQMLVLTNLKTRQDAICRVVKVRSYSSSSSYVEVEFTHRQAGYWGVYFESDTPEPTPATNADVPAAGTSSNSAKSNASAVTGSPAQPANDDSTFIHFGVQEEVQPSASTTSAAPKPPVSSVGVTSAKKPSETAVMPEATKAAASSSASVAAEEASEEVAERSETTSARTGDLLGSRFGADTSSDSQAESSKKWIAIGAGGAALVVAIIVATLFMGHKPATTPAVQHAVTQQTPAPQEQTTAAPPVTVTPTSSTARPNVTPTATSRSMSEPVVKPSRETAAAKEAPVVRESPSQPEAAENPAPVEPSRKPTNMPSVFGTLNAHPTARTRSVAPAAPNITSSAAPENELLGITAPTNGGSLPVPALNTNVPVPVGGRVKTPVLVRNVLPQYPALARESHTQGDVVVQIVVDKAGNVTEPKVVSGPSVLRQAAIEAVREWKYRPTILDGQPVSVQMSVTLRFQL